MTRKSKFDQYIITVNTLNEDASFAKIFNWEPVASPNNLIIDTFPVFTITGRNAGTPIMEYKLIPSTGSGKEGDAIYFDPACISNQPCNRVLINLKTQWKLTYKIVAIGGPGLHLVSDERTFEIKCSPTSGTYLNNNWGAKITFIFHS